jgi:hypothetical protein
MKKLAALVFGAAGVDPASKMRRIGRRARRRARRASHQLAYWKTITRSDDAS